MSLLEVLSENYVVCRNHLLSYLDLNDLLRLRRVSKPFKDVAEVFIRTKKIETSRALEVDFKTDKPFEQHFKFHDTSSVLPRRISLELHNFKEKEKSFSMGRLLQCFLDTCGTSNVTKLLIEGLVVPQNSKGLLQFFDSFPNVTHLELREILPFNGDSHELSEDPFTSSSAVKEILILNRFKKLQHLQIYPPYPRRQDGVNPTAGQNLFAFCVQIVDSCISNLERLCIPFDMFLRFWKVEREEVLRFACTCLFNDYKVKLKDVIGSFIEKLLVTEDRLPEMGTIEDMRSRINTKVVSVYLPEDNTFLQKLPNLENIEELGGCAMPDPGFVRQEWAKLGVICVDFKNNEDPENWGEFSGYPSLAMLWSFLFIGIIRTNVVELQVGFVGFDEPNPYFPRTMDILTSCPNLKTLHLRSNVQQLVVLPELWKGLPHLEELSFSGCSGLSDADFVGEDQSSPVFWNLKRLIRLELSDVEEIKGTDKLFSKVLCHMPLKKLIVRSRVYVDSITQQIESLLDGRFATTIESLSLYLAGVSSEEMNRVKKLFRSWKMI